MCSHRRCPSLSGKVHSLAARAGLRQLVKIYIYIYIHTHTHIRTHTYIYAYRYIYMYTYIDIYKGFIPCFMFIHQVIQGNNLKLIENKRMFSFKGACICI